jgi:hypothetical protein
MLTRLHAPATTTPKTRAYLRASPLAMPERAAALGVHATTIRRWTGRAAPPDRAHRPHRIQTRFDATEEVTRVDLRRRLNLSRDDINQVMRRCLRPDIARAGVHRCLKRHGVSG